MKIIMMIQFLVAMVVAMASAAQQDSMVDVSDRTSGGLRGGSEAAAELGGVGKERELVGIQSSAYYKEMYRDVTCNGVDLGFMCWGDIAVHSWQPHGRTLWCFDLQRTNSQSTVPRVSSGSKFGYAQYEYHRIYEQPAGQYCRDSTYCTWNSRSNNHDFTDIYTCGNY